MHRVGLRFIHQIIIQPMRKSIRMMPPFVSYLGREYMGYKWQCVEFARRYLYLNHGMVFTDVGMAYEIFSLRFLRQVVNDALLPYKPLQMVANVNLKQAPF